MAKVSNIGTRIYLDQYNLSGFRSAAEQTIKQETIRVECFSDSGPRRVVGNYDHSHSHNGFFDPTDDSFDEQIFALLADNNDHYLCHLFGANSEGSVAHDSIIALPEQSRPSQKGAAILLNLKAEGRNGMSRGLVLRNATISGNGNGTGRNVGASTSGQIFQVVFRVISGTFTSFDLKIQESQNDGGADPYADVTGLAQTGITTAGVWRKTTTAATEAWKRLVVANWNGTDAVVLVTAGIVAGT